jgi:cysteine desulfurase
VKILPSGLLDMSDFKAKLKKETIFGSFMLVNNEIGTILPLREISKILERFAKQNNIQKIALHTDAVQAPLYIETNPQSLGVDMLTLDGAKLYGPKGSGLLYKRKQIELSSILERGAHERGLRPGAPNVPSIVGLSVALRFADKNRKAESERLSKIRDIFLKELGRVAPDIKLVGTIAPRIANNINIFIPKIESEFAVIKLDHMGFAVSSASACQYEGPQGSYVTTLVLKGATQEGSAIRITMGRDTAYSDLTELLKAVRKLAN